MPENQAVDKSATVPALTADDLVVLAARHYHAHESTSNQLFALLVDVAEAYIDELQLERVRRHAKKVGQTLTDEEVQSRWEASRPFMGQSDMKCALLGLEENLEPLYPGE